MGEKLTRGPPKAGFAASREYDYIIVKVTLRSCYIPDQKNQLVICDY